MKIKNIIAVVWMLIILNSCWKDDLHCISPCYVLENGHCVRDTINFHCPSGTVHGIYEYYNCACRCERGWTGNLCDQIDTNYYVSFRFGTDTLNLSAPIRTSSYSLTLDSPFVKVFDFVGTLPVSHEIDTLFITKLSSFYVGGLARNSLCTDSSCTHLELLMHNGDTATAVSGSLTINNSDIYVLQGTFEANLTSNSGISFYMRDGEYYLPFIK